MAKTPANVAFDQRYEVLTPADEAAIPVTVEQWDVFMERIESCGESSQFFDSVGWACIGFAGSAFLSALTFFFSVEFERKRPEGGTKANLGAVISEVFCGALGVATAV